MKSVEDLTLKEIYEYGKGSNFYADPVFKNEKDNWWYYWDEVWAFPIGPFKSELFARIRLYEFCKKLNEEYINEGH